MQYFVFINEFEDLMVVCQYLQILRTYLRN